jgi:predicted transcriptional regulator
VAKVLVSIPDDLLARVDREAERRRTSRSAFLQEAARRELGWPEPGVIDAAVRRGRDALAAVRQFDPAESIRTDRDERDARDRRR